MSDDKLIEKDISTEEWREYDFLVDGGPFTRTYRIYGPQKLFYRVGGTTHRITDVDGVAHCVPVPGEKGCVLRWKNFDTSKPVNF
jgi:hypothetical protein